MDKVIRIYIITVALIFFFNSAALCSKSNFIIAIDIGHSIKRHGATSSRGVGEFYFNKNIATLLFKNLHIEGYSKSFLINESGADIPLAERTNTAVKKGADIFISIHHDSVQPHYLRNWNYKGKKCFYSDIFRGFSLFYSTKNGNSKKSFILAQFLGDELIDNGFIPTLHHAEKIKGENRELVDKDKGIYKFDELYVLKNSSIPSVLLECGIIVNRDEEILLASHDYQKKLVSTLIAAINKVHKIWTGESFFERLYKKPGRVHSMHQSMFTI